ncbi:MAG TPA: amidohydrolase [Ilumatobacteraceae bacterium]|nr:amidohydrolase [Ilumatobacteraceae bacterium]
MRTRFADLVISGGPVITMDDRQPRAETVAVRDGRIVAVGSIEELAGLTGPATEMLDLDGRTLLPGLIDPHMHFVMVQLADWVDVSPMATPTEPDIHAALRSASPTSTGWVLAKNFDPSITAGHPSLGRDVLDRLVPDLPLIVLESNGHIAWANSEAFRRAGVDRDTPNPPTARFTRDADGELTGRLEESAALMAFAQGLPRLAVDEMKRRINDLFWHAASKGVTLLHDCGIGATAGTSDLDLLEATIGADSPVRYRGMLVSTHYDEWMERGVRPGHGDDLFRIDGIKAWSDGSNQAGTGYQRDPYLGSESRGALNYSPEALADVVAKAHRDGWQIGVHANGDAAIDVTIDAFEQALAAHPRADHRHRIEHCSLLHPEQIKRMAQLGLSPSFLIGHVRWWGKAFRDRLLGAERSSHYDPCASALAAGLRISLHSDWNVTPLEPLRYVEDAVNRIMAEGGDVLNAAECIPVEAALRAITLDAAWQCQADDITGSLEVGKYADFVLLEDDPTTVDPTTIANITVSETRLAGIVRHSS